MNPGIAVMLAVFTPDVALVFRLVGRPRIERVRHFLIEVGGFLLSCEGLGGGSNKRHEMSRALTNGLLVLLELDPCQRGSSIQL
jgi:hypothetical protein